MRHVRLFAIVIALLLAAVSCTTPIQPRPDQKPQITEYGRRVAEGTIFALKTLRTIADCRSVVKPVVPGPALLDTFRLASPLWTPAALAGSVGRGLTKKIDVSGAPQLGASLGSGDTVVIAPDSILDSAISLGDSTFATRYRVGAGVLDSGWQTGIDSLVWRLRAAGPDTLALVRTMTQIRGDTLITDRRGWVRSGAKWSIGWRRQARTSIASPGLAPSFQHLAALSGGIWYDTLVTRTGSETVVSFLARRDNSPTWWRTLQNSVLYSDRDSTVGADTTVVTTISSGDSDSVAVNFADTAMQPVRIHETVLTSQGHTVCSADIIASIDRTFSSLNISSFAQSVVRSLIDSVWYRVDAIDASARSALLYTTVVPRTVSKKDSTIFGLRRRSDYQFTLSFAAGWDRLVYTGLKRTDQLDAADTARLVEYSAASTDIVPAISLLSVRVTYPITNPTTRFRLWTKSFADTGNRLVYTWIGIAGDSLRCTYTGDSAHSRYVFDQVVGHTRRGSFDALGSIADTLIVSDTANNPVRRIVQGTLGNAGVLHVSGLDRFDVRIAGDTAFDVAPATLPWTFTWHRSGNAWSAAVADSQLDLTFGYTYSVDASGVITGSFIGADPHDIAVVSCTGLTISAEGGGTASIMGIIAGAGDLAAWLRINLWSSNNLNDVFTIF